MRRITSLLLTVAMLVTMLSVFSVSANAEEPPEEIVPTGKIIISNSGNYIISGDYTVDTFKIVADCTLTIEKNAKITVTKAFSNDSGTIYILGDLIVEINGDDHTYNKGTIHVSCGGTFTGRIYDEGTITYDKHTFVEGVCSVCDHHCPHETWDNGVCHICSYACPHDGNTCVACGKELHSLGNGAIGSALSEGSLTIVCTVAAAVIFGLGGFLLGKKKKKPALAGGVENKEEE